MTTLRRIPTAFSLVLGVAATAQNATAADVDTTVAHAATERKESVEELAAKAATAFRAGQFEAALADYQRALELVTRPKDLATLRMNIGACLIELDRLEQAKAEFLKAAELEPTQTQRARLSAALVALKLDRIDEAQALVDAASPVEEALSSRAQEIKARIAERRSSARRASLQRQMGVAAAAIAKSEWNQAEPALHAAQQQFDIAEPSERVDILHSLGTVQLALNRANEAKVTLGKAVALAPNDPEVRYALGRAHQALGETSEARAEFRRALELGLEDPQAESAKNRIATLEPLGPSEWFGWLSLAAGYDSNPRQSGAATETTLGRRGRGGSAYGRMAAELGRTQRLADHFSLRLRYAGEWLGLQKRLVRDLSLQNHGVFAGLEWAPSDRFTLGLDLGPSLTYIGLDSISPFTSDFLVSTRLRYRGSEVRSWRLSFDVRAISGAAGWEFLGGSRLDGELSHQWSYSIGHVRLGLRGRYHTMGTRTTVVEPAYLPACASLCAGANYHIPLSYSGFGPVATARLDWFSTLHMVTSTQLDWRRYRDESNIEGVPQSRKRREDLRWSAGIDLKWALDTNEHFMIVPGYAILVSSSNVALDTNDPAHAFDYDNRSFTQHFFELGVEASF